MRVDEDARIHEYCEQYLTNWGPIAWRERLHAARPPSNPELGDVFLALSAAEADSRVVGSKIRMANLDRREPVREFLTSWLAEEAEHGRALEHLARLLKSDKAIPQRGDWLSLRSTFAWPALFLSRAANTTFEAVYFTTGAITEYLVLTTYRECSRLVADENASRVLLDIAAQEGRHMRFYKLSAEVLLRETGRARRTAFLLRRFWRPPGMDTLGEKRWLTIFRPLFTNGEYIDRMRKVDDLVQSLPGLHDLKIMEPFLVKHGLLT